MPASRVVSRRSLLRAGALLAVGGGLVVAGPGLLADAAPAPLTASSLRRLLGSTVRVRSSSAEGSAVVHALRGNAGSGVLERSFQVDLRGPHALAPGGEVIEVQHDSLGRHDLFAVPDRDPATWVIVVQDLAEVTGATGG